MKDSITSADLKKYQTAFAKDPKNLVAMNAATKNGVHNAAARWDALAEYQHSFTIDIESGDVTNQKNSGRCWMFAALNVMRLAVMKKLNLKNMELSQSYPLFYDKLEKANYFLENILATLDEPLDGRVVSFLLEGPLNDGGQWDMFRSLVAKYGVVPKEVMPDSENASNTTMMNKHLTTKLREYACQLRTHAADGATMTQLRKEKDQMMTTVYQILCISLGQPPEKFSWGATDKKRKHVSVTDMTPQAFFKKYVGWNLDDYVTVINAPTADKPYGNTFTVKHLGSVWGGAYPVKYLNLPMEDLRELTLAQLKNDEIVWFGSDVGQFSDRDNGFLCLDAYDLQGLFGTDFPMDKAQRLDYGESLMTHAMAITGVELDKKGKPLRWKVENSWGKEPGKDGYYVMSDAWFGEFAYQILLNKKYFSAQQRKQWETDPIELAPWDPMGSLAW